MWTLVCLDITQAAGGPMGSPTVGLLRQNFHNVVTAQAAALTHFRRKQRNKKATIRWRADNGGWDSGDLGAYQYTIEPIRFEDQPDGRLSLSLGQVNFRIERMDDERGPAILVNVDTGALHVECSAANQVFLRAG